jgi:hypothetical protein
MELARTVNPAHHVPRNFFSKCLTCLRKCGTGGILQTVKPHGLTLLDLTKQSAYIG